MRKSVFGGKGGGCEAPVFNHLFWKIYTSTFKFLHLVYELEFNFIFERNAKKMFGKIEKSIQLSSRQLSKASRSITYRSYNLKPWNISEGRVSSLLKSRVLCKKIST